MFEMRENRLFNTNLDENPLNIFKENIDDEYHGNMILVVSRESSLTTYEHGF